MVFLSLLIIGGVVHATESRGSAAPRKLPLENRSAPQIVFAQTFTQGRLSSFLSDCDSQLQSISDNYVRILEVALSFTSPDSKRLLVIERILNSLGPIPIYSNPKNTTELQVSQAVSPLLTKLTAADWEKVKAKVRFLASSENSRAQDRSQKQEETSALLRLERIPENDIVTDGAIPVFLDMGEEIFSVEQIDKFRTYKINRTNGKRELIGEKDFGRFLNRPIVFKHANDEAIAVSLSAGFQINIMMIKNGKLNEVQNFIVQYASKVGHLRLPDGRHLVTVQTDAQMSGPDQFNMNVYEVGRDGKLSFKCRHPIPRILNSFHVAKVVEGDKGPVVNLYAMSEIGRFFNFELDLNSLTINWYKQPLEMNFDRNEPKKLILKDGSEVLFTSSVEGFSLVSFDSETGFPMVSFEKKQKWGAQRWSPTYFQAEGRDFFATVSGGFVGVSEITDSKEVKEVDSYSSNSDNTMHGFALHKTVDGRIVMATSIGSAVQLFEFIPSQNRVILVDEVSGSLQSQAPYFLKSSDGKDDFMLATRNNTLQTFRLKHTLKQEDLR